MTSGETPLTPRRMRVLVAAIILGWCCGQAFALAVRSRSFIAECVYLLLLWAPVGALALRWRLWSTAAFRWPALGDLVTAALVIVVVPVTQRIVKPLLVIATDVIAGTGGGATLPRPGSLVAVYAPVLPAAPTTLLLSALVVPLVEEVVFRGALLRPAEADGRLGRRVAAQAALFGGYHANFLNGRYVVAQVLLLAIVGLFWGVAAAVRRSATPSLIGHATFNALLRLSVF